MSPNLPSNPVAEDPVIERLVQLIENICQAVCPADMTRDLPVSGIVRKAVEDVITRDAAPSLKPRLPR